MWLTRTLYFFHSPSMCAYEMPSLGPYEMGLLLPFQAHFLEGYMLEDVCIYFHSFFGHMLVQSKA